MKNKIYLITEDLKKKVSVFNLMKLAKIHEFPNSNIEKITDILNQYDNVTMKSWFTVDIKLGTICMTFQKENAFNNPLNFQIEYFEKIIEKIYSINSGNLLPFQDITNSLKFLISADQPNFNSSLGNTKKILSYNDKISSNGFYLFKNIFSSYINSKMAKILEYVESNFDDKKGILKAKLLNEDSKNDSIIASSSQKSFPNIFIYSITENIISIGPYMKEISTNYILPNFLKELFVKLNF